MSIQNGIKKRKEMYAYYKGSISQDKTLIIRNENNEVVKEGQNNKDINDTFNSIKLNKN